MMNELGNSTCTEFSRKCRKQGKEKYDQRVVNLLRPGGGQFGATKGQF
jgi:hypothetical protein